jgi:hypothetical protein
LCSESCFVALHHQIIGADQRARLYSIDAGLDGDLLLAVRVSGVGVPTLNQTVSTLRFFFRVTLRRYDIVEHTHFIHEPRKLPVVLSL